MNFGSLYDMFSVTFREPWVIQRFLPEVKHGDKRIILVDGEFAGAVNRVPAPDDLRSNMVRGGAAQSTDLSPREREICERLKPALRERGPAVRRHRCDRRPPDGDQTSPRRPASAPLRGWAAPTSLRKYGMSSQPSARNPLRLPSI